MDGLHAVPQTERAGKRSDIVRERSLAWLVAQGDAHGFAPDPERFAADGYETWQIPREGVKAVSSPWSI